MNIGSLCYFFLHYDTDKFLKFPVACAALGQGTFQSSTTPGQGPSSRLPPYPGSPGIFPQGTGPGSNMEPGRLAFQPGMTFQSGMS